MSDKISSNLDDLETTAHKAPPESYRSYCISHCEPELNATREAYAVFDEINGGDHLRSFDECRTGAWFARNVHTGKVRVLSSSCKLRFCPMCSATRRWHLTRQVSEWLHSIDQPKFLTLTVKHSSCLLNDQIVHLYESFRSYRRLNLLKHSVRGGVWFFQIHKSKADNQWHPHLHCVIDSPWLDKYALSAGWELVTKDSKIINIKEVRDESSMAEYVARYAARPSMLVDLADPDRLELMTCLHGRRLVGTWGNARTISLRPCKPPDAGDWKYIGQFTTVALMLGYDDRADAIWNAYKNDTECPDDCDLRDIENHIDNVEIYNSRSVEEHKQIFLDFY